ncbi:hypothetical protein J6TS2_06430 [Heyndrickxia sporothermodurans]|nr:hypothetical protein J6TS2_06430 [Heyndrickxia sporothermodurans]
MNQPIQKNNPNRINKNSNTNRKKKLPSQPLPQPKDYEEIEY